LLVRYWTARIPIPAVISPSRGNFQRRHRAAEPVEPAVANAGKRSSKLASAVDDCRQRRASMAGYEPRPAIVPQPSPRTTLLARRPQPLAFLRCLASRRIGLATGRQTAGTDLRPIQSVFLSRQK